MEYASGQLGLAVLAGSPFNFFLTSHLLTGGSRVRTREGLDTVQTLFSNTQNTGVLSTLSFLKSHGRRKQLSSGTSCGLVQKRSRAGLAFFL